MLSILVFRNLNSIVPNAIVVFSLTLPTTTFNFITLTMKDGGSDCKTKNLQKRGIVVKRIPRAKSDK